MIYNLRFNHLRRTESKLEIQVVEIASDITAILPNFEE